MATTKKVTKKDAAPAKAKTVKAKTTKAKKAVKTVNDNGSLAVIMTGGKQYLVKEGQVLNVEKLGVAAGEKYTFDQVLLVSIGDEVNVGSPLVTGAKVTAQVEKDIRGPKVITQKYKNKTRSAIKKGHRQTHSRVKILEIK